MSIQFDAPSHTYSLRGEVIPGVTTILRPLYDWSSVDPNVLAAKALLGTAVHMACDMDDSNDLDEASVSPQVMPYLQAWRAFRRGCGAQVLFSEQVVFEPVHRYAGTLDRVLLIDGVKYLSDIKTSTEVHAATGPQTAAYLKALGDTTVTRRAAVQLREDGSYRFHHLSNPNDFAVFMSCLTVHRFKEQNK